MHWPVGPVDEREGPGLPKTWYSATAFGQRYEPRPGRWSVHPGIDLNLRTGGDSDLGQPVFAALAGVVTVAGHYRVWGNIVLIAHGGIWTQYAHLNEIDVKPGERVRQDDIIGTIGKGDGNRFWAHLHYEVRGVNLPADHWPGRDRDGVAACYLDPVEIMRRQAS